MQRGISNKASKLFDLAVELKEQGKEDEAIGAYKKLLEVAPDWAVPWYNLGLIYKHRHDWQNCLKYKLRAAKLDPSDQPTWWNAGIAATALRQWDKARAAWRGFGIPVPPGDEGSELRMKIGTTPVRLLENKEVVWVERIDPARGIILNVPTEVSQRRYKDIVLNDGAPNGYRMVDKMPHPVFDELELAQASEYRTFAVQVQTQSQVALDRLENLCEQRDAGCENWTNTIRHVCIACSEGIPHEHHCHDPGPPADGIYIMGLATKTEAELMKMLDAWAQVTQAKVLEVECVL